MRYNNCYYVGVFVNHSYCVLALYFNKTKIEIEEMKNWKFIAI